MKLRNLILSTACLFTFAACATKNAERKIASDEYACQFEESDRGEAISVVLNDAVFPTGGFAYTASESIPESFSLTAEEEFGPGIYTMDDKNPAAPVGSRTFGIFIKKMNRAIISTKAGHLRLNGECQ